MAMPALALFAPTLRAQESIKIDVNLVNVAFSVRDASGALVDGLTQDDFEVLEDSAPQKIAYFAKSTDVPLTLGLVVDASGSQDHFEKQHEHDLDTFLKAVLGPKDRAFLVGFGNYVRIVTDFSRSGDEMMQQWKAYAKKPQNFPELGPHESRDLGTAFYDSIFYSIEEKLAKENGRRALLIFSDGEDNSSSHDMMTTIEEAQQSERAALRHPLHAERTRQAHRAQSIRNSRDGSHRPRNGRDAHRCPGSRPADVFPPDRRRTADFLRSWVLPGAATKDNTFHKIVVRVKKPGLTVRSRTGYFSR